MTDMELAEEIERAKKECEGGMVELAPTTADRIIAALRQADLAQTEIKGHMRVVEKLRKAVFDNLPYLENLIHRCEHESVLLREHPQPCVGHDFCLMQQARKGADMLRAAIATKETQ